MCLGTPGDEDEDIALPYLSPAHLRVEVPPLDESPNFSFGINMQTANKLLLKVMHAL